MKVLLSFSLISLVVNFAHAYESNIDATWSVAKALNTIQEQGLVEAHERKIGVNHLALQLSQIGTNEKDEVVVIYQGNAAVQVPNSAKLNYGRPCLKIVVKAYASPTDAYVSVVENKIVGYSEQTAGPDFQCGTVVK